MHYSINKCFLHIDTKSDIFKEKIPKRSLTSLVPAKSCGVLPRINRVQIIVDCCLALSKKELDYRQVTIHILIIKAGHS